MDEKDLEIWLCTRLRDAATLSALSLWRSTSETKTLREIVGERPYDVAEDAGAGYGEMWAAEHQ